MIFGSSNAAADHGAALKRIAICGEAKVGKTTAISALLRCNLVGQVATRDVATIVTQGPAGEPAYLNTKFRMAKAEEARFAALSVPQAFLSGYELVEIPTGLNGEISTENLALAQSADILVWVTSASQAWRLTEKTLLGKIREKCSAQKAILVIARGDKLRSEADMSKISDRLSNETSAYFERHIFMHGAPTLINKAENQPEVWEQCGGQALALSVFGKDSVGSQKPDLNVVQTVQEALPLKLSFSKRDDVVTQGLCTGVFGGTEASAFDGKDISRALLPLVKSILAEGYFNTESKADTALQIGFQKHFLFCDYHSETDALFYMLFDKAAINSGMASFVFTTEFKKILTQI